MKHTLPLLLALAAGLCPGRAPANDAAGMIGAKAAIAAALRPSPKESPEPNAYDRFLLAADALEAGQVATRGAVPAADWLAAVDLAVEAGEGMARTIPAPRTETPPLRLPRSSVRGSAKVLLSVLPGPAGWDEIRAGLRDRAERLAAAPAVPAKGAAPGLVLVSTLRAAADFLGEGGRGAPASLDALAALPRPDRTDGTRFERALADVRRRMDDPGAATDAAFDVEAFLRQIELAKREGGPLRIPDELAALPDEEFTKVADLLFAPPSTGEEDIAFSLWPGAMNDAVRARLVAAALSRPPASGRAAWTLIARGKGTPEEHSLFRALVAAQDSLGKIRARLAEAAQTDASAGDAAGRAPFGEGDSPFSWRDATGPMGGYAFALLQLIGADLAEGRTAEAEALAEPLSPQEWKAVFKLSDERSTFSRLPATSRSFLEARLPAGRELLDSPWLDVYATACLPDAEERFEATCARLLGEAGASPKAVEVLERHRLVFARAKGDLDRMEKDFLYRTDPARGMDKGDVEAAKDWCSALEALGETNRLARALDRTLAGAKARRADAGGKPPLWAVPFLVRAGRFVDAEAVLVDALSSPDPREQAYSRYGREESGPAPMLVWTYVEAGRPQDALDFVAGWPQWNNRGLPAAPLAFAARASLAESIARALVGAGGEENAAAAALIARAAAEAKFGSRHWRGQVSDWPFEILLETMPGDAFRTLLEGLSRLDPYEERPWQWAAESLRRDGDLPGAEAAARRALEIDPTDGESPPGDRIRSYAILASILEQKGGAEARNEAATLRRVVAAVRAAEKGDVLTELGDLTDTIRFYDEAADLFADAYCVQWRLAERLRATGRADEAVAHYEETFRHMPAQFGQVASLCFGCQGVFSSEESVGAAERILPALAAEPGAGAAVHYLLGMLRHEQGRFEEAAAAYERALEVDPGHFDALRALLSLRDCVDRPAAEWARLQAQARRLDPFLRNHGEDGEMIVDWPGLWRAYEEGAAGAPPPDASIPPILYRFEAATRARDVAEAARRAAAEADEAVPERDLAPVREQPKFLPARLLVERRSWGEQLLKLLDFFVSDPASVHRDFDDYEMYELWNMD